MLVDTHLLTEGMIQELFKPTLGIEISSILFDIPSLVRNGLAIFGGVDREFLPNPSKRYIPENPMTDLVPLCAFRGPKAGLYEVL